MAYLKNENGEIIVDAILTKYGRDKLSKQGTLNITKFSLSDDEIDYALYNTNHPGGNEYYDVAIRELPVLEALPGDDVAMKFHLFTDTNSTLSTISNLSVSYPKSFETGLSTLKIPYAITPVLNPSPVDWKAVYYVAQLIDTAGPIYSLNGIISDEIGMTNQIAQTRRELAQSNLLGGAKNVIYAVGHSFTFTLLSLPRYARVFTIKLTAYGPVNTNSVSFNVTVNGAYSIRVVQGIS